ncbi:Metal tolerance protein 10 [Acorus calamus]|uniref:Metal tolerance protein 10 n=1 Tax=Acorus calamus TaxID=4465 RepID=A0AAV9FNP0_ACOCL|nr:Metal tolerance protein 10 [Acorus calamus]
MALVTVVKLGLIMYYRNFKNEIVRAYAQDHLFDVITNSIGLATAVLAVRFQWWIDPVGAILVSKIAPPDYLAKLTYLIWNHNEQIKHIDTVRAYMFGGHYSMEVDVVLPGGMLLSQAHDIGETLHRRDRARLRARRF